LKILKAIEEEIKGLDLLDLKRELTLKKLSKKLMDALLEGELCKLQWPEKEQGNLIQEEVILVEDTAVALDMEVGMVEEEDMEEEVATEEGMEEEDTEEEVHQEDVILEAHLEEEMILEVL